VINTIKVFRNTGNWSHPFAPAACLALRGDDALGFLQGQFSQDVVASKASKPVVYGLFLNHKGKVLADAWALRVNPREIWLLSLGSPAALIRDRLESHLIADDVVVEDHTAGWRGLATGGPNAGKNWATTTGAELPPPGQFTSASGGWIFRGRRGADESWEGFGPSASFQSGLAAVPGETVEHMERRRIAAGIPAVPVDVGPRDLPQEGGLDTVAVSFNKGCYLGQEVMARLHTRGQVRRRLVRVVGPGPTPERPMALCQGGKPVGELRSATPDGGDGWLGLAMVTRAGLVPAEPLSVGPTAPATARLIDFP
jgi:folate-binding protein YgfZ